MSIKHIPTAKIDLTKDIHFLTFLPCDKSLFNSSEFNVLHNAEDFVTDLIANLQKLLTSDFISFSKYDIDLC